MAAPRNSHGQQRQEHRYASLGPVCVPAACIPVAAAANTRGRSTSQHHQAAAPARNSSLSACNHCGICGS